MSSIDELLQQARLARQSGEFDRAEKLCRQALEIDGRCAEAGHLLGLVMGGQGQHRAAVECISRAIRLEGGRAIFHLHLAEAFRSLARLAEAEASCRQALRLKDDYSAAYNTLGQIHHQQGRFEEAAESFRRVMALAPDLALPRAYLAVALHALGRLDEALDACREAVARDPTLALAYQELGRILREQGRVDEAIEYYRHALCANPRLAAAEFGLGNLLLAESRLDEAVACYRNALALQPNFAEAHSKLAGALKDLGQDVEAEQSYRLALACNPRLANTHFHLGAFLQNRHRASEAAECYQNALRLKPDHTEAWNNLGTLFQARGELEGAIQCYTRALEPRPNYAEAQNNLGAALQLLGKLEEAETWLRRAVQLQPDFADAHSNLGGVLEMRGPQSPDSIDRSIASFRRAVELRPDCAGFRFNLGLALLRTGNFAEGWAEFEWRVSQTDPHRRRFAQPCWSGASLKGATILLWDDEGLGDTLQFVRYAELVKAHGARVIVECRPQLANLLASCPGIDLVITAGQPLPDFDVQLPMLSLGAVMGTTLVDIPVKVPYLFPDPALVEKWKQALAAPEGLKVGIAWQGNPDYRFDRFRSIPLERFAPLAAVRGVRLFGMQMGAGREQLASLATPFAITDLGDVLGDFHNTAAIMRNLDLVVTSDSVPAHLAGALGMPTWVALAYLPDWRWMLKRRDSPWYPTMRLYRQSRPDDWQEVFQSIATDLAAFRA